MVLLFFVSIGLFIIGFVAYYYYNIAPHIDYEDVPVNVKEAFVEDELVNDVIYARCDLEESIKDYVPLLFETIHESHNDLASIDKYQIEKYEVKTDTKDVYKVKFIVHLKRPGILIGFHGRNIDNITQKMNIDSNKYGINIDIEIKEV